MFPLARLNGLLSAASGPERSRACGAGARTPAGAIAIVAVVAGAVWVMLLSVVLVIRFAMSLVNAQQR